MCKRRNLVSTKYVFSMLSHLSKNFRLSLCQNQMTYSVREVKMNQKLCAISPSHISVMDHMYFKYDQTIHNANSNQHHTHT